jgi:hypothetical protein
VLGHLVPADDLPYPDTDLAGTSQLALGDRELEDINEYLAGKSAVLAKILKRAGLSDTERSEIARMNPPTLD